MNLEMANHPDIVRIALEVKPEEVCLVPERRQELTTEGGLDVVGQRDELAPVVTTLCEAGIAVSVAEGADISDTDLKAYVRESHRIVAGRLTRKLRAELGLEG